MQFVIVAGGKGTRLKQLSNGLPKPLIEIGGKPLIEHHVELARRHGISNILVLTGHGAEHIENFLGDGSRWSVNINYHRELTPLGTAGSVLSALPQLENLCFVSYGDVILNVHLGKMEKRHSGESAATLFLHPNDHPQDSDLVSLDESGHIRAFHPYPHPENASYANLVNAGLYLLSKAALARYADRQNEFTYPLDFGKTLFPQMIHDGLTLNGYVSREYIKDAGTPTRLDATRRDWETGRIRHGSLETPVPAVFLDRDGTLNHDSGWLSHKDQMRLLPGVCAAVQRINKSGLLAVVVSNQPVVARGGCSEEELKTIHNRLEWLMGESHAYLDGIYYCPHHPDKGFAGERPELKIKCACRKPGIELFERAAQDMNIDLARSWMVGDSAFDIAAAHKLGIRSALVRSNQLEFQTIPDRQPDVTCDTLTDAVDAILLAFAKNI